MDREDEGVERNPVENPPLAKAPYIRPEDWKLSGNRTRLSHIVGATREGVNERR